VYIDLAAVQFCLYASNRKHNVSPHELPGSSGAAGMFMSVLAAPIYVVALVSTTLRRQPRFVVTPKGTSRSADGLRTFRWHLGWGALLAAALAASLWMDHPQSSMRLWSLTLICVCLTPPAIAFTKSARVRRRRGAAKARRRAGSQIASTVARTDAVGSVAQSETA
jgi:hypothetical protein